MFFPWNFNFYRSHFGSSNHPAFCSFSILVLLFPSWSEAIMPVVIFGQTPLRMGRPCTPTPPRMYWSEAFCYAIFCMFAMMLPFDSMARLLLRMKHGQMLDTFFLAGFERWSSCANLQQFFRLLHSTLFFALCSLITMLEQTRCGVFSLRGSKSVKLDHSWNAFAYKEIILFFC